MSDFLVAFDGGTTAWRPRHDVLLGAIQAEWPSAALDADSRSAVRDVTWTFEDEHGPVEAYLQPDGTCVHIEAEMQSAAAVAVWFRRLVPDTVELVLCDVGYNFNVSVSSDSTVAELVAIADQ